MSARKDGSTQRGGEGEALALGLLSIPPSVGARDYNRVNTLGVAVASVGDFRKLLRRSREEVWDRIWSVESNVFKCAV